jgi:hypothetical protein
MKRITYRELKNILREHNETHKWGDSIKGVVVFTIGSFEDDYSLESRSYVVSSNNKAFIPGMGGYSIYASSIDGSDRGVRIEQYMRDECGGENGWTVDYCYMMEG